MWLWVSQDHSWTFIWNRILAGRLFCLGPLLDFYLGWETCLDFYVAWGHSWTFIWSPILAGLSPDLGPLLDFMFISRSLR